MLWCMQTRDRLEVHGYSAFYPRLHSYLVLISSSTFPHSYSGDSILTGNEQCDDGNTLADVVDGCSATCEVDVGYFCTGTQCSLVW